MSDKSSTEAGLSQDKTANDKKATKGTSDFVVGSVTFIIFIIFMIAWMYFQSE